MHFNYDQLLILTLKTGKQSLKDFKRLSLLL